MKYFLAERLTYDKLFRLSEPKRVTRSLSVRGPPLEVHSYQDTMYYAFNYKSYPSTTGLRWKGYVKFIKPKNPNKPLQHLECVVDCSCPDYRYRWAWANKQRGSGQVGPSSMNQAWNRAPKKTNPSGRPGLCKHILAARRFIYGMLSTFPEEIPDTAEKLDKLTKYAQTRWTDFPGAMQAAKDREAEIQRRQRLRNRVGPVLPPPEVPTDRPIDTQNRTDTPEPEEETTDFTKVKPPPLPKPTAKPPAPMKPVKPTEPKRRRNEKPLPGGAYPMLDSEDVDNSKNFLVERVVNANVDSMSTTIKEALKLVEEMEADAMMGGPDEMTASPAAEPLEPMEPPVSDSAIGADTEEDTALGLLRQMRDFLAQLATALAPEETPEEGAAEEGAVEAETAAEGGDGMPPEPPADELEDEEEEEKENEPPNRRPEE